MTETILIVGTIVLIGSLILIVNLIPATARAFGDEKTAKEMEEKLKKTKLDEEEIRGTWLSTPPGMPSSFGAGNPFWDDD